MTTERVREIIRGTLDQQTLPSGIAVALRPATVATIIATGRMPTDLLEFFVERTAGTRQSTPEEDVAAMLRYRRLEAAAAVVEMWDGKGEWQRVSLIDDDLDLYSLDDQRALYDYAIRHSDVRAEEAA